MRNFIRGVGRAIHSVLNTTLALLIVAGGIALANYAVTVGTGTNFGSIVVSSVHYAQQLVCDQVTVAQCIGVTASNEAKVIATGIPAYGGTTASQSATLVDCATQTSPTGGTTATSSALSCEVSGQLRTSTVGAFNITPTDCSSTIATGGTAQNAVSTSATRRGIVIANLDNTNPLWISWNGTAAANTVGSYPLPPGSATTWGGFGSFMSPQGGAFNTAYSVVGASTGHKFSCTTW